jgi:NADH-quinone oxidoreductase subunit E
MSPKTKRAMRKYVYRGTRDIGDMPAELTSILDRYRGEPDALITVLAEIQEQYGYLSKNHLHHVSQELGFALARVYGVATFYNLFLFEPPGQYKVRICRGTACHVNGSGEILRDLREELGIQVDETTPDGRFTLQTIACMGACSLAPVVVIDGETHGRMSLREMWRLMNSLDGIGTGNGDSA